MNIEYGVSALSDALDIMGVAAGRQGLRPAFHGARLAGPAFTVAFEAVAPGTPSPAADYIDEVPAGHVLVLDNGGRTDCTVFGDILAHVALRRQIAGCVIDGSCRDVDGIARLGFPVFSRDVFMQSGKNRVRMVASNRRITLSGQPVDPDDWICADGSGVIVVPRKLRDEAVRIASDIDAMERRVIAHVERGIQLAEARRLEGYNRTARSLGRS